MKKLILGIMVVVVLAPLTACVTVSDVTAVVELYKAIAPLVNP
jgi:hypothetical protein